MAEDPKKQTAEVDALEEYLRKVDMRLRDRGYVMDRGKDRVLKKGPDQVLSSIGTLDTWIRPGRIIGQGILAFVGVAVVLGVGLSLAGQEPGEVAGGIGGWAVLALWGFWIWNDRRTYLEFTQAHREVTLALAEEES